MPGDWWILLPGQNHVDSSGSGQQPHAKQLGFPTLIELASDCVSPRGYSFPKGPGEICPVHLPINHENRGSCPKTAECQDWKGLGNFLIHPSSFFIYRNPDSERRAMAYDWVVTTLKGLLSPRSVMALSSFITLTLIASLTHQPSAQEWQIHGTHFTTQQFCA